jgi:transposase
MRRAGRLRWALWRKGVKVHVAVDTLGHLLALLFMPDNEQERAQVEELAIAAQAVTGEEPAAAAAAQVIQLAVVKLSEARRGFVLLTRRWVVEHGFAWAARFRRLARDDERLAAMHFLAFACLLPHRFTVLPLSP